MRLEFDTAKAEAEASERENDPLRRPPPANGATQKARKRRGGDGIGGRKEEAR